MRESTPITPEEDVLVVNTPGSMQNPNDWPEFELHNARVTRPADNAEVPLLQASEHHALRVVGSLRVPPKHADLVIGKRKSPFIELTNVKMFAYGTYSDGGGVIWAAGLAGWYVVNPARSYKPVYQEMIEAVKVLYFIVDAYNEPREVRRGKSKAIRPEYTAEDVFQRYAAKVLKNQDAEEAAREIYRHRDFLFSAMMAGKENVNWEENPFYIHLCDEFPADREMVRKRMKSSKARKNERAPAIPTSTAPKTGSKAKAKRSAQRLQPAFPSKPKSAVETSNTERRTRSGSSALRNLPSAQSSETERQTTPIKESDNEDEDNPPRRGKSSLRPRPSIGMKGRAKGGKLPPPEVNEDGELDTPSHPATAGKRKAEDDRDDRKKKRRGRDDVDEGIDIPDSASGSEDITDGESASKLAIRNHHVPDPVQEDTWVCALDGCTHKVYAASDPDSQRLIREHYTLHAYDDDERVQMVQRLKAPSLPVSHLMERVKMTAKAEGFPGSKVAGTRFPEPIVQRY